VHVTTLATKSKSATELAEERTDLATTRSVMAADRSLMAWIRTALSMISFGFTIYKVLESFQASGLTLRVAYEPQLVGLVLTGLGTVSIVMGTVEYWFQLKDFSRIEPIRIWRPTFVIALVLSILGVGLFAGIVGRQL
jgi:inner membrane protein YidH